MNVCGLAQSFQCGECTQVQVAVGVLLMETNTSRSLGFSNSTQCLQLQSLSCAPMTESLEVDERKGEAREATSSRPETRPNKLLVLVLFSFRHSRSLPFRSLSARSHPPSSPSLRGRHLRLLRRRLHLTAREFAIGSARAASTRT